MALAPGTSLGPYQIVAPLGAGGMGEVYRAHDRRLNRDVAIKVLPADVARDADRRARFEREALAVAALSHPNILAIHDTGSQDDHLYVVTELLDGETLAERLTQGALPVRKAIEIAIAIARGLSAAHSKGIAHRDLKPANVFLLADAQVKILDFGLAKAASVAQSGATQTQAALTDAGTVLGTAGYMAPEQIRGQAADGRADLFALGVVLYEMLTGTRAFARETTAESLTAILKEDPPDLSALRADLPPALDRTVRHCLEKNPNERFQSARDVIFALEGLSEAKPSSGALPVSIVGSSWLKWAAFAVAAVALLAGGIAIGRIRTGMPPSIAFEAKTWDSQWITNARFAPDGQSIVFSAATSGNEPSLYIIRSGTLASQLIGEPRTHLLSVSSKGELAVITQAEQLHHRLFEGQLATMTLDGAPQPRADNVREADWGPDGATLAIVRVVDGLDQLEYPSGHSLYNMKGSGYLSDLRVSPDGLNVAFFEHPAPGDDRGWVAVTDRAGKVSRLSEEYWGEEGLAWSRDSRQLYFSASLRGEAFQPLVVDASGTSRPRQALPSAGTMVVQDISADGRLLATHEETRASIRVLVAGQANEQEFAWLDFVFYPFVSNDSKLLLFTDQSQSAGTDYAVRVRNIGSGTASSSSRLIGPGISLGLSPDGKWAAAHIPSANEIVLYPTGVGEPKRMSRGPIGSYQTDYSTRIQWFPDGRRIFFCGNETAGVARCYEQEIDRPGALPKAITPEGVVGAQLSGDGRAALLQRIDSTYLWLTIGGDVKTAKGLLPSDRPLSWTRDDSAVLVQAGSAVPAQVVRVDPASGSRTTLKEVAPPDRSGLVLVKVGQFSDDGRRYSYDYTRTLSKLYVVSGLAPQ